jgi:hypothetical protein
MLNPNERREFWLEIRVLEDEAKVKDAIRKTGQFS